VIHLEESEDRRYERLKYGLVVDLAERVRTLDRNLIYLYSLVNFFNDYYKTFFNVESYDEESIVYSIYSNTLEYIIEDMEIMKKNLERLCDATLENLKKIESIEEDEKNPQQHTKNPYIEFIKEIRLCGYLDENYKSDIFKDFQKIKISGEYKDGTINPSSVDEFLMNMRHIIAIDTHEPIRISLGSISKAIESLTYSINQSMGGLFIGNIIEQEPSVYPHKDLFMIINIVSFLCRGYDEFLRSLFRSSRLFKKNMSDEDKELKNNDKKEAINLFYCVSGVHIGNNDNGKKGMQYTIVFGTSILPELMERYKLIHLPITCAYRPRYWGVLAHEVSHSYIQGLLYFEKILDEVSVYEISKSKEKARKLLKELRRYPRSGDTSSFVNYIYHLIKHSSEILEDNELREILNLNDEEQVIFKLKITQTSEIVADILGFLLSGYAYIPALASSTLTIPQSEIYYSDVIPHIFRIGVVIGVAEELSNDKYIMKKILDNLREYNKDLYGFEIIGKFLKYLQKESAISEFLKAFEYMINNNIITDYDFTTGYYLYTLGKNLGEVLYESDVKPLIKSILESEEIKNFGWFKISSSDKNEKEKYYVLANIWLNYVIVKRIEKILGELGKSNNNSTQKDKNTNKNEMTAYKLNRVTCYSPETREVFRKFREIWRRWRCPTKQENQM
jgi:hypothetical protein